jgi:hypothetical protein
MSEERAAAHITGFYTVVSHLITGFIGVYAGVWLANPNNPAAPAQPAASAANVTPTQKVAEPMQSPSVAKGQKNSSPPPASRVVQASSQESLYDQVKAATESAIAKSKPASISEPEAEPIPTPTDISLFEYDALIDSTGGSPVERLKAIESFRNKTIDWVGYFGELIDQDSLSKEYRFSICSTPGGNWGAWCYVPQSHELTLSLLQPKHVIRIKGLLKYKTSVDDATIEMVGTASIGMDEYLTLLRGDTPLIETSRQYIGKHIEWKAQVHSLDTYPDDDRRRYRLLLVPPEMSPVTDYVYCYLSKWAESELEGLHAGSPVRVTGILVGRTDLKLMSIASDPY